MEGLFSFSLFVECLLTWNLPTDVKYFNFLSTISKYLILLTIYFACVGTIDRHNDGSKILQPKKTYIDLLHIDRAHVMELLRTLTLDHVVR